MAPFADDDPELLAYKEKLGRILDEAAAHAKATGGAPERTFSPER